MAADGSLVVPRKRPTPGAAPSTRATTAGYAVRRIRRAGTGRRLTAGPYSPAPHRLSVAGRCDQAAPDATIMMGRGRRPRVAPRSRRKRCGSQNMPKGVRVVPLRAVRTEEGYKSVYSELTRPTVGIRRTDGMPGHRRAADHFGLVVLLFAGVRGLGQGGDRRRPPERPRPAARPGVAAAPTPIATTTGVAVRRPPRASAAYPATPIARLHIPRLDKHWVVVQGVDPCRHPLRPRPLSGQRAARPDRQLLRGRAPHAGHLLGPRPAARRRPDRRRDPRHLVHLPGVTATRSSRRPRWRSSRRCPTNRAAAGRRRCSPSPRATRSGTTTSGWSCTPSWSARQPAPTGTPPELGG